MRLGLGYSRSGLEQYTRVTPGEALLLCFFFLWIYGLKLHSHLLFFRTEHVMQFNFFSSRQRFIAFLHRKMWERASKCTQLVAQEMFCFHGLVFRLASLLDLMHVQTIVLPLLGKISRHLLPLSETTLFSASVGQIKSRSLHNILQTAGENLSAHSKIEMLKKEPCLCGGEYVSGLS